MASETSFSVSLFWRSLADLRFSTPADTESERGQIRQAMEDHEVLKTARPYALG